ncbi:DUF397 domain-containing protein [Streptomyces griseoloalbus]|uniref:DUF397 domain-containing protein n=1 Tax=Streptomyces griseoloalbus TaxID=67303 RepID=A0A7W8F8Q0_9ACTN|nr:DUF397 domain-containing protein [Streptomyces albaduncus]MBB5125449.1 hypothetical protein [Streptomyces albaduncus]GGW27646.1 hypothetical protein GCM10010340_01300 [Streptomyces albaduncus]
MPAPPRTIPSSLALHGARWLRSSYSTGANNCVETARPATGDLAGLLAVRDSKHPAGPALLFSPGSWGEFVAAVR